MAPSPLQYNYDWEANYDRELMLDFNWFLRKINQRACIDLDIIDEEYTEVNRSGEVDLGLGRDVDYFHPTITLDDRMRYIAEVIAPKPIGDNNVIGNTLISHFYGARGIHQVLVMKEDVNECLVDFDRIAAGDEDYKGLIKSNIQKAKENGLPIWGTTELHTPLIGASRDYCRAKYSDPTRPFETFDLCEWVAGFKQAGLIDKLLQADDLKQAYAAFTSQRGIGKYFGFHASTSTSVLPMVKYHHDQRFVELGPGSTYLVNRMWPNAPKKYLPEAIYFLRENADRIGLTKDVYFHPETWNIVLPDGSKLFKEEQDGLKYYGTEVLCCQMGVYLQIRNDPRACSKRKVSRLDPAIIEAVIGANESRTLEDFFS